MTRIHSMAPGPADQRSVREHNLALVFRHVATLGPRSRAQVALETGLNKSTVSSLVGDLIDRGLLREDDPASLGAVGRPARSVHVAGEAIVGLGLEIGEGHLAACSLDLAGTMSDRVSEPLDNRAAGPGRVLEALAELARRSLQASAAKDAVTAGIVVAVPGLVNRDREILHVAPNLDWSEVGVAGILKRHLEPLGVPVHIENDANLAALAELREGVCRGIDDFVYLYGEAGLGVGAGIVSDGKLFRGWGGLGGEVGHMPLIPDGPLCRCGNRGCLEAATGLGTLLESAGIRDFDSRDGSAQAELVRRLESGEPGTEAALDDVSRTLAMAAVALANVLNPSAIVLGGYFATVGRWLGPRVQADLDRYALAVPWSRCEVLISELGSDAALRGAAALAVQEVLANPASVG